MRYLVIQSHCGAHLSMFRVLLSVCFVPVAMSIIVTDPPPTSTEYNYSYNIVDPHTGDTKSLHEVRRGDVVTGSYSVVDPDGTHRVVHYTADSKRGFKAVVHSEPLAVPFHHAVRDPYYFPRGNVHYLNQYYSADNLYSGRTLPQPLYTKSSFKQNGNENSNKVAELDNNRETRYFTPTNDIKTNPVKSFKKGEYFAPSNN